MRGRIAALAAILTAVILGLGAPGAQANVASAAQADIVSTGTVTSITSTSALLNGLAFPSLPDSFWTFQYGTTTGYAQHTAASALGSGLNAVDVRVSGLQPATVYHYRLEVVRGAAVVAASPDATFTTAPAPSSSGQPPYGKPRLISRRVAVVGGKALISFRCTGPAGARCPGLVAISVKRRLKRHSVTTPCAAGQDLALAAAVAPLRLRVRGACLAALRAAATHRLGAELDALFAGQRRVMRRRVTLVLKHS